MAIDDRRRLRPGSLRVLTWRGDQRVAVLSPAPEGPTPEAAAIADELDALHRLGVTRAVTGALHSHEVWPFLATGFEPVEHLHLLRHDLVTLPPTDLDAHAGGDGLALRRAWRRDRRAVLDIDARAFDDFWTLDARGLDDAIAATPTSRFRVLRRGRGAVVGYTVSGLARDRGYLQRLAVDPDLHRRGLGRTLVADSLGWLRRGGARFALVNTQVGNHAALSLYRSVGFVPEPAGLTVLARDLAGPPGPAR